MEIKLLTITPDAEKHIERATRICYNSEEKITDTSHETFLPTTLKHGHFSALSHAFASFHVAGISRACSHQLVRHAHLRYLQRSQRYCTEDSWGKFVRPPKIIQKSQGLLDDEKFDGETPFDILEDAAYTAHESYQDIIALGVPKEDARYALPNCQTTELVISGTFQAWWDFLRIRLKELLETQPTIKLDVEE
jgi:thymidylate synthase (FAD)